MPTLTTRRGFSVPVSTDPANVPSDMLTLANALDTKFGSITQGVLASRPATGKDGDIYWATDDATLGANGTPYIWRAAASAWGVFGLAIGAASNQAVAGNDARMTNARTPTAHATTHAAGGTDEVGEIPIGGIIPFSGSALPTGTKWQWADGGLIDRTTFATFFAVTGHAYNGGVDPGSNLVRKPDKRGRASIGADNFGVGAAGRITVGSAVRGGNGGVERVTLAAAESGVPAHSHADAGHGHGASSGNALTSGIFPIIYPAFASVLSAYAVLTATFANNNAPLANNTNTWSGGPDLTHSHGVTVNSGNASIQNNSAAGASTSHQNMPPYEADTYIVRVA